MATARFLQSIGLQLIMAEPELERIKFKAAANTLMVSDMPGENPEVLASAYQQLGLTPSQMESVEADADNG